MDFLILAALIVLNGCFAMAEIALVTARRNRLQKLADAGDKAAATAIKLGSEPTRFLSTVQIGITAIGVLNGIAGEAAFAEPLALRFIAAGLEQDASEALATALVVVLITFLTIVAGELVPKRIGQSHAERIARLTARPIALLARLSRPFVNLLALSTEALLKLLRVQEQGNGDLTEDDIHAVLSEGSETGIIEKHEHDMVRKVLRLEDRPVSSLMTPRGDIVWLDAALPLPALLQRVDESPHSRFPVCDGDLQNVLGIVSAKQLLRLSHAGGELRQVIEPAVFVPDTITGMEMLEQLRDSGESLVLVVDEYGGVVGLVSQQDVLEALAGEFRDAGDADDEGWAFRRDDGSWLLDGLIPIHELKDRLELRSVPEEERAHYHTLSGMMMALLGTVPRTGARAEWEDWRLEVIDMDGNRVDKILATRVLPVDGSG
jgi:putative hemolysin